MAASLRHANHSSLRRIFSPSQLFSWTSRPHLFVSPLAAAARRASCPVPASGSSLALRAEAHSPEYRHNYTFAWSPTSFGVRKMSGAAQGAVGKAAEVYAQLRGVVDPDFREDIVSLGFVQQLAVSDAGAVTFDLELTTPACPVKDEFRSQCETLLRALPWVTSVTVNISAKQKIAKTNRNQSCPGLSKTKRIIAVSSAKGGVGKSTVAVNLAFSIAALGGKVGIFDADIFGPSLPTMLAVEDTQMSASEDNAALIAPLQYGGVKLMSQGFTPQGLKGGAASMRGPMVASRVHQLIAFTDWGELDYLIIDMPPGTGDIQLTIAQEVHLDGAVIVTTPQKLSFVDVVRGIDMFDTLSVPVIGLVENMGHFKCGCGQIHRPFGPGHARVLTEEYGTPAAVSLPIDAALSACGDGGRPLVLDESSEIAAIFSQLAAGVVKQISINAATIGALPLVEHQQEGNKEIPSNVYRALSCALFAVR